MIVVRIEHPVADYEAWKGAFDADPADRRGSGVRRYRIFRATDDPNSVMIDLEFDTEAEAEAMLASLRAVWDRVQGHAHLRPARSDRRCRRDHGVRGFEPLRRLSLRTSVPAGWPRSRPSPPPSPPTA